MNTKKLLLSVMSALMIVGMLTTPACAQNDEKSILIDGNAYATESSNKDKGEYDYNAENTAFKSSNISGSLSLSGNIVTGSDSYVVDVFPNDEHETVKIEYSLSKYSTEELEKGWYISNEDEKSVGDIKLDGKIKTGALIVEMSRDGENWVVLKSETDIYGKKATDEMRSYEIQPIQMQNGSYFKVTVAYQLANIKSASKGFLGFGTKKATEYTKNVEVYEFYIKDDTTTSNNSPENEPLRKYTADKYLFRIKKDKGYDIAEKIDFEKKDDPQFADDSKLGYFVVNGYSGSPDESNGILTFTKNAGDDITLWFCFNDTISDISDLFGDGKVSVTNDKKAYDKNLGIKETTFGYGALFVKFTDMQNDSKTEAYFDFLKAAASPTADTRIRLYEEGTYEITLDYKLKSGLNTYNDYKMNFTFEIKNGNCMVFFREGDGKEGNQGSELSNMALANDGFYADFAGSKDLEVTFQRSVLIPASNGTYKEDVRENKGVNDMDSFYKEGVYVFTVHNKHTDQKVYKTLIIGEENAYKAMSKNALDVKELNEMMTSGYNISSEGMLVTPSKEK